MEIGLFQKQTMNLVMTTELRQAISLLQYNTISLSQFIQEQAVENPLIELEEQSIESRVEDGLSFPKKQSPGHNDNDVSPLDLIAAQDQQNFTDDLLEQAQYLNIDVKERTILRYLILNLDDNGYLPLTAAEVADQLEVNRKPLKIALGFCSDWSRSVSAPEM